MLHIYDLCRLCAQKKRHKVDLFTDHNEDETDLLAKISLCLSVQVTREDMLPKTICIDCQRAVEQFNAFRVKCLKAEERLNKMLLTLPNKVTVTRIKQECQETDFSEITNSQMKLDSPRPAESYTHINLKSVKNVKCEVEDLENETNWNSNNDLIQIISEEIVNQQYFVDVKQPQIEIISENFHEEFKTTDDSDTKEFCDIKVIPEILFSMDESNINTQCLDESNINTQCLDVNFENKDPPEMDFVEIKEPIVDNEDIITPNLSSVTTRGKLNIKKTLIFGNVSSKKKKVEESKKLSNMRSSGYEIDEKYLTLREGETCDIDIEEMDALIKKKQDPNTVFKCDKCNKVFKFFKCLRKHKHWHDSQPDIFICDYCKSENLKNFEFSSLKSLNSHIQRKHLSSDINKFPCDICLKVLPSKGQLNAHCRKVHDTSGATCHICEKKFKNKSCLTGHLKVHQEERPYVCDQCGQSFKWSNTLKVHIQWHKQEKNFLCSECGKKFTTKKNLIEHLNIHSGNRPHVCQHCNASFVQLSAYSKHLYLHNEGKRVHKCDKCERSYSHAYMLKQHMLRHSGLRPYECSTCHHTFKSQSDLCCHVKIHQEKQHACQVCGKKFALSKTLRDHMVRHTGIKHICPVPSCGKTYSQRFSLTKHFCKQHPSLSIVRKKSGKKAHLCEKSAEKDSISSDYIRYDFTQKEESFIIN